MKNLFSAPLFSWLVVLGLVLAAVRPVPVSSSSTTPHHVLGGTLADIVASEDFPMQRDDGPFSSTITTTITNTNVLSTTPQQQRYLPNNADPIQLEVISPGNSATTTDRTISAKVWVNGGTITEVKLHYQPPDGSNKYSKDKPKLRNTGSGSNIWAIDMDELDFFGFGQYKWYLKVKSNNAKLTSDEFTFVLSGRCNKTKHPIDSLSLNLTNAHVVAPIQFLAPRTSSCSPHQMLRHHRRLPRLDSLRLYQVDSRVDLLRLCQVHNRVKVHPCLQNPLNPRPHPWFRPVNLHQSLRLCLRKDLPPNRWSNCK